MRFTGWTSVPDDHSVVSCLTGVENHVPRGLPSVAHRKAGVNFYVGDHEAWQEQQQQQQQSEDILKSRPSASYDAQSASRQICTGR